MSALPKRILYVDHTAVLGGGELALLALLGALDRTQYEPVVLLLTHGPFEQELAGIAETHVLPLPADVAESRRDDTETKGLPWSKSVDLLRYCFKLRRTMKLLRPALVHTNSLKADFLAGIAAKTLRLPTVWHMRDRIDEHYLPKRMVQMVRTACRWLPNAIIANSETTLATLHLPPKARARAISSGVALKPFAVAAAGRETFAQALRSGKEVRVGLIGRISPWKGQDIFLQAAAIVHASHPQVRFFIIGAPLFGEDQWETDLHALAVGLGLRDRVVFTGFQRNMPEVIANLHLIVHASTIPEPFGQVIVQGMAAGRPVIAAEGGGPSEIIENGQTGFLTPRGDPEALAQVIHSLLADSEHAQAVSARGQAEVLDRYSALTTTRQVEELYRELI